MHLPCAAYCELFRSGEELGLGGLFITISSRMGPVHRKHSVYALEMVILSMG